MIKKKQKQYQNDHAAGGQTRPEGGPESRASGKRRELVYRYAPYPKDQRTLRQTDKMQPESILI